MLRALAVGLGLLSAFFVFYTVRLLAITRFLLHTRAGGQGAFIGAVAFPVLAVGLGWAAVRCWRRAGRERGPAA